MRVLFDSRCASCGNIDEVFGNKSDSCRCTKCNSVSQAIISPVRSMLEGLTGDFPGAAYRWQREHERAAKRTDNQ